MSNSKLTAIATRMFTSNDRHYRVAENICLFSWDTSKVPAKELRKYYAMAVKIKANDEFGQAALDAVDWDSITALFVRAVAA